ncbi:hypothetical protein SCP_0205760 [Sparassis crispa]|uniref:Uncharacterized protein n=1 Tax=Sparassis crispa TaxID=139825 RepID=A0A401GB32_9APHY|nr:hypothetical protein SCP_0205760 [Sparassis crispa]GBE79378.1 hypothetical protein SCP_0205760 [Sparassis crispa]
MLNVAIPPSYNPPLHAPTVSSSGYPDFGALAKPLFRTLTTRRSHVKPDFDNSRSSAGPVQSMSGFKWPMCCDEFLDKLLTSCKVQNSTLGVSCPRIPRMWTGSSPLPMPCAVRVAHV